MSLVTPEALCETAQRLCNLASQREEAFRRYRALMGDINCDDRETNPPKHMRPIPRKGAQGPPDGEGITEATVLPKVELLKAQNLHQKLVIETLQAQIAMNVVQRHEEKKRELTKELQALREDIARRHHINLDTHVILEETGEVVPKSAVSDLSKLASMMAGGSVGQRKG